MGSYSIQPASAPHQARTQACIASAPSSRGLPGGGSVRRKPETYPAGMPMLRSPAIMMWLKSWQTPWRAAKASANGVSTSVASGS